MSTLPELLIKEPSWRRDLISRWVVQEHDEVRIDWKAMAEKLRANHRSEATLEQAYKILAEIGILSTSTKGNYIIKDGMGTNFNPSDRFGEPYYFTSRKDAEKYKIAFCCGERVVLNAVE